MMTVLNRLRGTWSWMAKVTGLVIAILVTLLLPYTHMMQFSIEDWFSFSIANDLFYGLATGVMYVAGESFGWGKWIGGVYNRHTEPATPSMIKDKEGRKNGIHYLANRMIPETTDYYRYCSTALMIRGIYWFGITLIPLVVSGYLYVNDYVVIVLILGYGFPLSVKIGSYTTSKFNFKFMNGFWEHAEVWYGLMQDIVLILFIVSKLL